MLTGRQTTPLLLRALIRLGELQGHREAAPLHEAAELLRRNAFAFERALLLAAQGRCALNHLELPEAGAALREALHGFEGLGDLQGQATALASLFELARLQGPLEGLRRIAAEYHLAAAAIGRPQPLTWSAALSAFAEGMAGRLAPDEAVRRLLQAAAQLDDRGQAAGVATLNLLAAELLLGIGREGEALDILQRARERRDVPPDLAARLDTAMAEALLLRAAERAGHRDTYLRQADVLLRRLDACAGWLPRLQLVLPRLEAMSRILQGQVDTALAAAEEAAERLEAQGARIPQGLLFLRVGEALKAAGADAWLQWCGRALSLFENVGAALLQRHLRRVVDLDPLLLGAEANAPSAFGAGPAVAQGTGHGPLLGLIERLGALQPAEQGLWERDLLRALMQAADADRAVLFLPNGEGALLLAAQLPGSAAQGAAEATPVNRWLVDAVWQEGAGQLLDPYQPPSGRDSLGYPETRSVLCFPLHSGVRRHGVAYREAERRRLIYEPADVARLEALGRQAGLALSLREHLGRIATERERMTEQGRRQQDLQAWASHAATLDDAGELLQALLKAPGLPSTLSVAVLFWRDGQSLQPVACAVRDGTAPAVEGLPVPPLALRSSCAAMAAAGLHPEHLRSIGGQAPAAEELALLQRLAAEDGVWLPLLWDGMAQGLLLLAAETRLTPTDAQPWAPLEAPARLLMPSLVRQRERHVLARALAASQSDLEQARAAGKALQRYLPAYLRAHGAHLAGGAGPATTCPVLFGQLFGLSLERLSRQETLAALQAYYARVRDALALHHGELARILGTQWVGQFPGAPDSALFGVLTLNQMLLTFRDAQAAGPATGLGTGLGLHQGALLGGTLDAGDHMEPVLLGEGLQVAQRLAGMSITFRTGALVSDELVQSLATPEEFDLRALGTYRVGPGERRIGVFELFSLRAGATLETMRSHQDEWREAIQRFRAGHWNASRATWPTCLTTARRGIFYANAVNARGAEPRGPWRIPPCRPARRARRTPPGRLCSTAWLAPTPTTASSAAHGAEPVAGRYFLGIRNR